MASSGTIEDEDLIDLEDGSAVGCASRATSVPEASAEELEHLLDVCPPQLEQKLSLSRKRESIPEVGGNSDILVTLGHDKLVPRQKRIDVVSSETIKRIRDITKNLEPVIRNCLNSRSSEEEPGESNDDVDGPTRAKTRRTERREESTTNNHRQDFTYETQAINSAFDFLSELDDLDDEEEDEEERPCEKRRRMSGSDKTEEDRRVDENRPGAPSVYPLEPTCFIEDKSSTIDYRKIDRANRRMEAGDETLVIERDRERRIDENHENPCFETSPVSKYEKATSHYSSANERTIRAWNDRSSFAGDEKNDRSNDRTERKSWSEGETRGLVWEDEKNCRHFKRSTSVDVDRISEPSTSKGVATLLRTSSRNFLRQAPQHSASSSECSDVDWSWVAEYETPSLQSFPHSKPRDLPNNSARDSHSEYNRETINKESLTSASNDNNDRTRARPSSAPNRIIKGTYATTSFHDCAGGDGAAGFAASGGESAKRGAAGGRRLGAAAAASEPRVSAAMSVVGAGKLSAPATDFSPSSVSIASHDFNYPDDIIIISEYDATSTSNFNLMGTNSNNETRIISDNSRDIDSYGFVADGVNAAGNGVTGNNNNNNNNNEETRGRGATTYSWLRASMRRIRHLRLPDAAERISQRRRLTSDSILTTQTSLIASAPNSLPDIALVAPEVLAAHTNSSTNSGRPTSAPVTNRNNDGSRGSGNTTTTITTTTPRRGRRHAAAARSAIVTRAQENTERDNFPRNNNNGAVVSADDAEIGLHTSSSVATSPQGRRNNRGSGQRTTTPNTANAPRRICERQREADRNNERSDGDDEDENPLGRWPHPLSPALACLGCTLGLFNISRFAILSVQFGANFIVQFLVLSLVLGIPLLTLQVCLGQRLAAGAVDMWRISPIFHGVGIALLVAQAFIGVYSIIGVSWMFVYFRDSFITKQDRYRWAEPFLLYREDTRTLHNATSFKLHETVPDYFSGIVLQRHHLNEPDPGVVTLKFQVAFNLAVVWMIVFVSLSKGLRSYGKVVYVFTLVPVFGTLVLCTKLLGLTPPGSIHQLFPATIWSEFFINSKSWVAASSEVFLTWGLLGAAAMQIAAHNKHKHLLQRDTSLVVVLTLVVLLLSAFLANTCVQILRHYGYTYTTSSFERISGYTFLRHVNQPAPSGYSNTPERFMSHASFLLGQRVIRPGADLGTESGYQALRLSTELVPATLAILGSEQVSPFWAVLFYFILILFGIAQQLAIWHCVITGIMAINTKMMKLWETTITFFSCACAYILGLPMATELGIYVVYYLDYTVGGAWWIMILYLVQVGAVFAVRGRPHTGETVVAELFPPTGRCLRYWAGPLLSFTWNVILPVALMVLSITIFKSGSFRDLYVYRRTSRDYWWVWARQLGAAIQLTPILIIPGVAIIQTCRYLNSGPPDIFDRIQLLYRPPLDTDGSASSPMNYGNETSTSIHGNGILPTSNEPPFEDPPPKYTPPPSYTTATGARIAKMLRQSFRRSVRRIASVLGETSTPRARPALQPPPPDYATVLVEMNQSVLSSSTTAEARSDAADTRYELACHDRNRPRTIDRMTRISTIDRSSVERTHSTMDRSRGRTHNSGSSNLTAADVANLLRSSIRRGAARTQPNLNCLSSINDSLGLTSSLSETTTTTTTTAASVENLVNAAVPINEDSFNKNSPLVSDDTENNEDDDEKKTANETGNSVSVI